jgi:hypothetical protein
MIVPKAKEEKVLRVLDLASPGTAARGYENSIWARKMKVEVKSIDAMNPDESGKRTGNITLVRCGGRAPEILYGEKDRAYDHIHFHMLNAQGIVAVNEADEIMFHLDRIMAKGGVLFFSMDHAFFTFAGATDMLATKDEGYLKVVDRIIGGRFDIVFTFLDLAQACKNRNGHAKNIRMGNQGVVDRVTSDAIDIAGQFGNNDLGLTRAGVESFYSLFSKYAKRLGEYFAIARKKE